MKDFILYPEALALKELGFNEPCLSSFDENKNLFKVWENDMVNGRTICLAPLYQQAFRFFREKYDLHVQIRKENYFQERKYEYYHFDISKGEENDITKQEDLLYKILDECSQDIPGNHLNDEMYFKLIFEKEFAFKTYEEVEFACLRHLIKTVKNENQI